MKLITIVIIPPENENEIHVSEVDQLVDGSIDEIIVNDTLDFVENRVEGMTKLVSKLAYGGVIHFRGLEIFEFCRQIYLVALPMQDINTQLYKDGRASCDSIVGVVQLVQDLGLTVIIKSINKDRYYVKAKRELNESQD